MHDLILFAQFIQRPPTNFLPLFTAVLCPTAATFFGEVLQDKVIEFLQFEVSAHWKILNPFPRVYMYRHKLWKEFKPKAP